VSPVALPAAPPRGTWAQYRASGALRAANQAAAEKGWRLIFVYDDASGDILDIYPSPTAMPLPPSPTPLPPEEDDWRLQGTAGTSGCASVVLLGVAQVAVGVLLLVLASFLGSP
jgi:hypothetical protein